MNTDKTYSPSPFAIAADPVNHPAHYTSHPSEVECIDITEHMNFCLGNAVKYIWRADLKANALEDLRKARWYLNREIERRERLVARRKFKAPPSTHGPTQQNQEDPAAG